MKTCQRYGRRTRDEGRGTLERLRVRRQGKSPPGLARMLRSRRRIQVLSFSSTSSEERTRRALQRALVQRGWRATLRTPSETNSKAPRSLSFSPFSRDWCIFRSIPLNRQGPAVASLFRMQLQH